MGTRGVLPAVVSQGGKDASPDGVIVSQAPSLARARIQGLLVLLLMLTVLLSIEWLIPGDRSLTTLSPSPYWIPVILISALYGTASGVIAAALSAACSITTGWIPQSAHEDFFTFEYRIAFEPALWLTSAVILGEISNYRRRESTRLRTDVTAAKLQSSQIGQYCRELEAHIAFLERRFATTDVARSNATVDYLRLLETSDREALPTTLETAVRYLLGDAVIYGVFLRDEAGVMKLAPHYGGLLREGAAPSQDAWDKLRGNSPCRARVMPADNGGAGFDLLMAPLSASADHLAGAFCIVMSKELEAVRQIEAVAALIAASLAPTKAPEMKSDKKDERIAA